METQVKLCSFPERLSRVSPNTSPALPAALPGSRNPPCRSSPAACRAPDFFHTSAVRFQQQKTATSRRVSLFLWCGDREFCWQTTTERALITQSTAGGKGYSPFNPATSDSQSSPLCSTAGKSLEEHPRCIYLETSDKSFDLPCATIPQHANQIRAGSLLEARCCA